VYYIWLSVVRARRCARACVRVCFGIHTTNPHTFPFIHAQFSVPNYMQLGVVGSKLKGISV
jgi:hypothetical protein